MTAAQVPEPTAEQWKTAHVLHGCYRDRYHGDDYDSCTVHDYPWPCKEAEITARAVAAAIAEERAKCVKAGPEKTNDERHADRHRTVGNTTFCAVRGCGWSDK